MKIRQGFTLADTPERGWRFPSDARDVAGCVPGRELTELRDDDGEPGSAP